MNRSQRCLNVVLWMCLSVGSVLWAAEPARKAVAPAWPLFTLRAEATWQLNLPQGAQFDASGLLIHKPGELFTINDRGAALYRIEFRPNTNAVDLIPVTNCFTTAQLQKFSAEKRARFDGEGIAQDEQGRLYVCEEADRWILRCDPNTQTVERLKIDFASVAKYFTPFDGNASFEGIAVGAGKLYVANERMLGRIITVDLQTLRVIDDFLLDPSGTGKQDVQYSDLCWFDGHLYALLRDHRAVVKCDPASHRILAEYSFREMEREPEVLYRVLYPTGNMEGLAVDHDYIWLVTDNNGLGRVKYPGDKRPTLFKCVRPDGARVTNGGP